MEIKNNSRNRRRLYDIAVIAVVLFLIVLLNVILRAVADANEWYFYSKEQYSHTAGGISPSYLKNDENKRVKIVFCMQEDELVGEAASKLVWQTACQLQDMYTFIDIENVNIYLDPDKVEPYRALYDEKGEMLEEKQPITTESVIFATDDRHIVFSLSDFFFLDVDRRTQAYNGEEAMAAGIRYVLDRERPIAYLVEGHGEQYSSAYTLMLVYAGYDIKTIDLTVEDIDPRAELIVCMQPLYDFERAAEGSGIRTELERLEEFLTAGGSFYLFADPYAPKPEKLSALLADWGLSFDEGIVRASSDHALTLDGYSFYAEMPQKEVGQTISGLVTEATEARLTVRDAGVLSLQKENARGAEVYPLLTSGKNARPYQLGEPVGEHGELPIAALSVDGGDGTLAERGKIMLVNTIYLTAADALQSDRSANRDFFYAMIEHLEVQHTPLGATTLSFENFLLEDLTIGTANRYTRLLVLWVPLALAFGGVVTVVRRRRK